MIYKFRPGARFPVKAQLAGETLAALRAQNNDELTPSLVVEESRDPDAPLHPVFCWDDEEAAERWREEQARSLMRSVFYEESGHDEPVQAYVAVTMPGGSSAYITTRRAMSDAELHAQVLASVLAGLEGWTKRHAHLSELREVFEAVDRVKARLRIKQTKKGAKQRRPAAAR